MTEPGVSREWRVIRVGSFRELQPVLGLVTLGGVDVL